MPPGGGVVSSHAMSLWLIVACVSPDKEPGTGIDPLDSDPPAPVTCDAPISGLSRFTEEGEARGLDTPQSITDFFPEGETGGIGGGVVAEDLDQDGDIDLLVVRFDGGPDRYENDGTGRFTKLTPVAGTDHFPFYLQHLLAEVTGDGAPDLVQIAMGGVVVYPGLGGMEFGPAEVWYDQQSDDPITGQGVTTGDIDGDGRTDLVLATGLRRSEFSTYVTPDTIGQPEMVLINAGDHFALRETLLHDGGTLDLIAYLTDADRDRDPDLWILSDIARKLAFYRNDGGDLADATADTIDMTGSVMGVDFADLNGDGLLDYCVSDTGPPRCIMSDHGGPMYESGAALGLETVHQTVGWSIDIEDLDYDGWYELYHVSGPQEPGMAEVPLPDLFWQGSAAGFSEVTDTIGTSDLAWDHGLITADFDGDGWLDLFVSGSQGRSRLYMNRCGTNHHLQLRLEGPPHNPGAVGTHVKVEAGDRAWYREVRGIRGQSQGPAILTFGLGDLDRVDAVTVYWPEGERRYEGLAVDRLHLLAP